jgi:hypothetical protein
VPNEAKMASPQVDETKEVESLSRLEAGSERSQFSGSERGGKSRGRSREREEDVRFRSSTAAGGLCRGGRQDSRASASTSVQRAQAAQ